MADEVDFDVAMFLNMKDFDDLAAVLNIKLGHLLYIAYKRSGTENYREFEIPKKSGGTRKIKAPVKGLGIIQKKLKEIIEKIFIPHRNSYGFIKKKSIVKNANLHKNSKFVLIVCQKYALAERQFLEAIYDEL